MKISRHAKKRIKQRIHKNYKKVAEEAWEFGLNHKDLKGKLKKHVDWMVFQNYKYPGNIKYYKVYNENVFLFNGDDLLVTVLRLPVKYVRLARKLTSDELFREIQTYQA